MLRKDSLMENAPHTDISASQKEQQKASKKTTKPPTVAASADKSASSVSSRMEQSRNIPAKVASVPTTSTSLPASSSCFNNEAISILREMHNNQNKTNESVERLSHMVDELYSWQNDANCYDEPAHYETEDADSYAQNYDDFDDSHIELDENAENKRPAEESIFGSFLKKFKKSESTDTEVQSDLADLVNDAFREGMPDDTYSELIKSIHRPANCENLKETRVNQGVWSVLKSNTQTEDSKLRGIQNAVVKATINLVKIMNAGANTFDPKMLEWGTDAIGVLGQANKWINLRRKDLHKRDMDPKLHYLCTSSVQYTDQLYGDSIVKDIKDAQEINKISRQVAPRGRGQRGARTRGFRGRGRAANYYRKRGNPYNYQSSSYTAKSSSVSTAQAKNYNKQEHKKA